ncbi:hypothetical protein FHR99_001290 [Litorivivens lipolytica]|uniref:DUF4382 domain-containing protein n=1 Tax=Litorivivens lipolytica TaxID=1524264 RepID=A0A7W4W536_9GAMM|nr:DUF4382 domain-containing protein [Litorivivens lipolytica]MBB3047054.1 hypothetical protein [Litorivivens lipolytica]
MKSGIALVCATALLALPLVGCNGGGGSDASPPQTGEASFSITDAPADNVSRVKVTFDRIELKPREGAKVSVDLDPAVTIENLLDLTGSNAEQVLGSTTVPAGEYNYVRLYVQGGSPASEVEEEAGGVFDLLVPGQQAGANNRFLQLVSGFTVPAGGRADFTIDVDLRAALTKPSGADHYLLRPALRIVDNVVVGTISGTVDEALLNDASCTHTPATDEGVAVYLYESDAVGFGDVYVNDAGECQHCNEGSQTEASPLTTANVTQDTQTGAYTYTIGFVEAGEYDIALTCQSLDDDPAADDAISFLQSAGVTVVENQTSEVDFVSASSP